MPLQKVHRLENVSKHLLFVYGIENVTIPLNAIIISSPPIFS